MSHRLALAAAIALTAASGCSGHAGTERATPSPPTSTTTTTTPPDTTTTTSPPETTATTTVTGLTAADLPRSWRAGCPVSPAQLRRLQVGYWGFDDQPHVGAIVVNATVADAVRVIFTRLYSRRFPIRRMEPVDAYGGNDEASLAADNTAGFNCRRAVVAGPPHWSAHAYGVAIDVNPVENPYIEGGRVHPASGGPYLTRSPYRAGMAVPGGELVGAFATVGWRWGGRWTDTPDYQHFSSTGG